MPSTPQARCAGARAERLVADGEDGDSVVASINSRIVAAPPVPYLPRLRALALFGRRSVEREEPPRCRRPKTCTMHNNRHPPSYLKHLAADAGFVTIASYVSRRAVYQILEIFMQSSEY